MSYNRQESKTQTVHVAALQEKSLEVWGKEPRGSSFLKVQAYKRALPDSVRGINFDSHVEPDPDGHPHIACWSGERPGVFQRQDTGIDYVGIKVVNFKNAQPEL